METNVSASSINLDHPLVYYLLLPYLDTDTLFVYMKAIGKNRFIQSSQTKNNNNNDLDPSETGNSIDYLSIVHEGIRNNWYGALISSYYVQSTSCTRYQLQPTHTNVSFSSERVLLPPTNTTVYRSLQTILSILNLLDDIAYRYPLQHRSPLTPSSFVITSPRSLLVVPPSLSLAPSLAPSVVVSTNPSRNPQASQYSRHFVHSHPKYTVREGRLYTVTIETMENQSNYSQGSPNSRSTTSSNTSSPDGFDRTMNGTETIIPSSSSVSFRTQPVYPSSRAWIKYLSFLSSSSTDTNVHAFVSSPSSSSSSSLLSSYLLVPSVQGPGKYLFTKVNPTTTSSRNDSSVSRCMGYPLHPLGIGDNISTSNNNTIELDLLGQTDIHSYYYMNTLRSSTSSRISNHATTVSSSPVAIGYFSRSSSVPNSSVSSLYSRLALSYETPYLDGGGSKIVLYDVDKLLYHIDQLFRHYHADKDSLDVSHYEALRNEGMRPGLIDKFVSVNGKGETILATALAFDGGNIDIDTHYLRQYEYMEALQTKRSKASGYDSSPFFLPPCVPRCANNNVNTTRSTTPRYGNENLLVIGSFSSVALYDLRIPKYSFGHSIPVLSPVSWYTHRTDVYVRTVALDTTTNRIGMGCSNGKVYIFDARKPGELIFTSPSSSNRDTAVSSATATTSFTPASTYFHNAYNGWTEEVRNLVMVPFSPYSLTNCYDGTLRLWCDNNFGIFPKDNDNDDDENYNDVSLGMNMKDNNNNIHRSSSAPYPSRSSSVSTPHTSLSSSTLTSSFSSSSSSSNSLPEYRILSSGDTSCESLKVWYQLGPVMHNKSDRSSGSIANGITVLSTDWLGKATIAHCTLPIPLSSSSTSLNGKNGTLRTNSLNSYFTEGISNNPNDTTNSVPSVTFSVNDVDVHVSIMDILDPAHVKSTGVEFVSSLVSSSTLDQEDMLRHHVGLDRVHFTDIDSTTDLIIPPEPFVRDIERIPSQLVYDIRTENSGNTDDGWRIQTPSLMFVCPPVRRSTGNPSLSSSKEKEERMKNNSSFSSVADPPANAGSIWLIDPLGL